MPDFSIPYIYPRNCGHSLKTMCQFQPPKNCTCACKTWTYRMSDPSIRSIPQLNIESLSRCAPTSYKQDCNSIYNGYDLIYSFIRPFKGVKIPFITIVGAHLVVMLPFLGNNQPRTTPSARDSSLRTTSGPEKLSKQTTLIIHPVQTP